MKLFCLYITVHPTGKFYLGKGIVEKIKNRGYKGSGKKLLDAFKKYPKDEWTTKILLTEPNEKRCYELEAQLIDAKVLKDHRCLNLKIGGEGMNMGAVHSVETKAKMKNSALTMPKDKREKIRQSQIGHRVTAEARINLSKSGKGRIMSEEHKRKLSEAAKNRKYVPGTSKSIGKIASAETRLKQSIAAKARGYNGKKKDGS